MVAMVAKADVGAALELAIIFAKDVVAAVVVHV